MKRKGEKKTSARLLFFLALSFPGSVVCARGFVFLLSTPLTHARACPLFKVRLLQLMRWKLHELLQSPTLLILFFFLPLPRKKRSRSTQARPSNKQLSGRFF